MTVTTTGPEGVLEHLDRGADLIVPLANGEPVVSQQRVRMSFE